jgi:hypothetical protein
MKRPLWLILPVGFVVVLGFAAWLHPHPEGFGTHRDLGLPSCFFRALTGLRCPSCGLTTSFSFLVHLQFWQSLRAHPLGPLLFVLFAWASVLSLVEFFGRKTRLSSLLAGRHFRWVYGGITAYLSTWIARLLWDLKLIH